jgi:hypothetical protein
MSMLDQTEKRQTLVNDVRVRDQSNTFLGFTHSEVGGRFKVESKEYVVGRDGPPRYPQLPASSPWSGLGPEPGQEPPLGAVSRPEQFSTLSPAPALPNPTAPSDPLDVERLGLALSSHDGPALGRSSASAGTTSLLRGCDVGVPDRRQFHRRF